MCWPMVALGRWSHAPCLFIHAASPPEPYPLSLHDALPICGADGVLEGAAAALGAHGREGDVVADVLAGDPLVGGDEIGRGPGAVGGVAVVVAGHEDPVGGPGAGVVDAVPGGRDGRAVRGGDGVAGADVVLATLGREDV